MPRRLRLLAMLGGRPLDGIMCARLAGDELGQQEELSAMHATMIGLDIAKTVFQVHGEDDDKRLVVRKRLGRAGGQRFFAALPPAVIGLEACGSARTTGRASLPPSVTRCGSFRRGM